MTHRRQFLVAAAASIPAIPAIALAQPMRPNALHVSTQSYPWLTFANREKRNYGKDWDADFKMVAEAGFDGFEPGGATPEQLKLFQPLLRKHGLAMRTLYVGGEFHTKVAGPNAVKAALASAEEAKKLGCTVIVTNPSPIRWGGPENKTDDQLKYQGERLTELGRELKKRGMTLAYHNHDIELRNAGREFHHMLTGTDPDVVKFCLDAHWVYRGSGDSNIYLFDMIKLYGPRIVELHVRQSKNGVWTESFGPGDIDYASLVKTLQAIGVKPHIVLEQAVEGKTPNTMTAVPAHKASVAAAREVFAAFAD